MTEFWTIWFYSSGRRSFAAGHGGDEWGNCTVFLHTPLFGIVWRYPTGHRQEDVLLPSGFDSIEAAEWMTRYHLGHDAWLEMFPERMTSSNRNYWIRRY